MAQKVEFKARRPLLRAQDDDQEPDVEALAVGDVGDGGASGGLAPPPAPPAPTPAPPRADQVVAESGSPAPTPSPAARRRRRKTETTVAPPRISTSSVQTSVSLPGSVWTDLDERALPDAPNGLLSLLLRLYTPDDVVATAELLERLLNTELPRTSPRDRNLRLPTHIRDTLDDHAKALLAAGYSRRDASRSQLILAIVTAHLPETKAQAQALANEERVAIRNALASTRG